MMTQWCGIDAQTIRSGAIVPMPDTHNPQMSTQHSPPMNSVAFFRDEENLDSHDPEVKRMRKRLSAAGLRSFLGARVEMENAQTVPVALHGDANNRWAFAGETLQSAAQFMPHVRQVFAMKERSLLLSEREAVLLEVVGRLNCGLALLGVEGFTLHCNDAVEHMVADHGELTLADGQLVGRTPHDHQRLRALLGEVACGRNASAAFAKCADLIHISGYATDKGISVFTPRFHLKQVLAKTGALRQSDLVGLTCTSRAASIAQTDAQSPA